MNLAAWVEHARHMREIMTMIAADMVEMTPENHADCVQALEELKKNVVQLADAIRAAGPQ